MHRISRLQLVPARSYQAAARATVTSHHVDEVGTTGSGYDNTYKRPYQAAAANGDDKS